GFSLVVCVFEAESLIIPPLASLNIKYRKIKGLCMYSTIVFLLLDLIIFIFFRNIVIDYSYQYQIILPHNSEIIYGSSFLSSISTTTLVNEKNLFIFKCFTLEIYHISSIYFVL
ncbi:hypothetical protein ACJX0J_035710, partial [Zea mays]